MLLHMFRPLRKPLRNGNSATLPTHHCEAAVGFPAAVTTTDSIKDNCNTYKNIIIIRYTQCHVLYYIYTQK